MRVKTPERLLGVFFFAFLSQHSRGHPQYTPLRFLVKCSQSTCFHLTRFSTCNTIAHKMIAINIAAVGMIAFFMIVWGFILAAFTDDMGLVFIGGVSFGAGLMLAIIAYLGRK